MKIAIVSMITGIVEALFPRFSDPKLGMLIMINCCYDKHTNNGKDEMHIKFPLYYLIHRPSNHTKVLLLDSIENDKFRSPPSQFDIIKQKNLRWVLRSDHDSCWRCDGFCDLLKIENKIINTHFGGYPITPEKVYIYNSIGGIGNGIYFVELEPFRINREESAQNIVVKKTLTVKEAAELMPSG